MYKINCLNPIAKCGTDLFGDQYALTENTNEADAILVRSAQMHELELSKDTIAVARAGAGVNNIPLDKYAAEGVVVFNTPGANANGAVNGFMGLGMMGAVGGNNATAAALNTVQASQGLAGSEIKGKKLGVIGLGAIGAQVANAAVGLGMEVYGFDPYVSVDAAWNISRAVKHITNVNDIYTDCDYITIHVPLLDSTKGMVDAEAISKMKKGVIFLNFARDILIDEKALLDAIDEGHVKKYVTDFANPTVAGHKGVICTPHLGASTEESEDNCAIMAVKEIRDFIENGNVVNSVNYPRCEAGVCESASRVTVCHKNIPNMLTHVSLTGLE